MVSRPRGSMCAEPDGNSGIDAGRPCGTHGAVSRLRRRPETRRLAEGDEIREQLIRAVNAGRQLAPETEADIHPPAFAVLRFDERAFLHTRVEFEPIGDLEQVLV